MWGGGRGEGEEGKEGRGGVYITTADLERGEVMHPRASAVVNLAAEIFVDCERVAQLGRKLGELAR